LFVRVNLVNVCIPVAFTSLLLDFPFAAVRQQKIVGYENVDPFLYQALARYSLTGKRVLVVGSQFPTYEAVALAYGAAHVDVVEYNLDFTPPPLPNLRYMSPAQLAANTSLKYDAVLSISSIEHDGLGRYGDPLNAWADVRSQRELLEDHMAPGGLLFLAVPTGKDCVVFNLHRIYG
jgi:hypothetical protein